MNVPWQRRSAHFGLLGLFALAAAGAVQAQPRPPDAGAGCTLVTPAGILVDFGRFVAQQGSDLDAVGQITLNCRARGGRLPIPVFYRLGIDGGSGAAGGLVPRQLLARTGTARLAYNLYLDPTRRVVLGNGTANTRRLAGLCWGTCVLTVYGRLFGRQQGPPGAYSDPVTVTVDY